MIHPFLITSLPRTGSTTLANLLNEHRDIRCLIEPFHPYRYRGSFHNLAHSQSLDAAMETIWRRWNGVKHVHESNGWPFPLHPDWNLHLVTRQPQRVIHLCRQNLLRRFVSNAICRQTGLWMGSRQEFIRRLSMVELQPLSASVVKASVDRDREVVAACEAALRTNNVPVLRLDYETFFDAEPADDQQYSEVLKLLDFLGVPAISRVAFNTRWLRYFNIAEHRWADETVYRRIPEVDALEAAVGSDDTGWLFR